MILRAIGLAIAVGCGLTAAQIPSFSQQYTQRLGGAVEALSEVVADFDAAASDAGLSRAEALAALSGTAFLDQRQKDMQRVILQYERLRADLVAVTHAGPFLRSYLVLKTAEPEILRATLSVFRPAMPLDPAGLVFGLLGGAAGLAAGRGLGWLLPRRRRRPA